MTAEVLCLLCDAPMRRAEWQQHMKGCVAIMAHAAEIVLPQPEKRPDPEPCSHCNGEGQLAIQSLFGNVHHRPCSVCMGTGIKQYGPGGHPHS